MLRYLGAGLILTASLWAGLHGAMSLRRSHDCLRDLGAALELMRGEIRYADTPFAPLCRRVGAGRGAQAGAFFQALALEAETPDFRQAGLTRRACLRAGLCLPAQAERALTRLFDGFGTLDREGQIGQIQLAAGELGRLAGELNAGLEGRCRTCEVLGISAGAAVLVLVL